MEELFDFTIERSTADDDLLEFATECVDEAFAYLGVDDLVEERHGESPSHSPLGNHRENLVFINLFEDQRHADDEVGLHIGKGFEQDFWRRHFA